jgi:hypothetical protein
MKTRESFEIIFDADVESSDAPWTNTILNSELKKFLEKLGFKNVEVWKVEWL